MLELALSAHPEFTVVLAMLKKAHDEMILFSFCLIIISFLFVHTSYTFIYDQESLCNIFLTNY